MTIEPGTTRTDPQLRGDSARAPSCRSCGSVLRFTFVDLGMSPLCESYLLRRALNRMEPFYPLHVYVCEECFLVQLEEYVSPEEIFTEYAYFSSYSDSWVSTCAAYADMIIGRLGSEPDEPRRRGRRAMTATCCSISSRSGSRCSGIEPAANVAADGRPAGHPDAGRLLRRRDGASSWSRGTGTRTC